MALAWRRRRFTVDDYHQMADAGILTEDDRVELIEGEVVELPPIGPEHTGNVSRFTETFYQKYTDVAQVSTQNPVRLSDLSEPQPDVVLLRRRADYYTSAHPAPEDVFLEDVFLVVEIAKTSIDYDRQVKLALYARSGIPEAWLVDLNQDSILVYRDPSADGYGTVRVARRSEEIAPLAFPDRPLSVTALLG
ncbi:MAG: Uma2 family endonuclease [Chloroflexi bacterium]|nr:Uma2 family endonuclease [Chloroflexota bacterium]